MDAIEVLYNEHLQFLKYFDLIEKTSTENKAELDRYFKELEDIVYKHMESEEDIFYVEAMKVDEFRTMVEKSYQSHHFVKLGFKELHLVPYDFDSWKPKFLAIRDSIIQHMTEEEEWLFPKAKELMSQEELSLIGRKIIDSRK